MFKVCLQYYFFYTKLHINILTFILSYRTMHKHMKQLSDWLREEEVKGHSSDDEDIWNAKQEVTEVYIL